MMKLDISGQKGNAFAVLAYAKRFSEELGYNTDEILSKMVAGDYEHLLREFNHWFDDIIMLVSPHDLGIDEDLYTIEQNDYI